MELLTQITEIVGADNVRTDEPMAEHTTFRAGGRAAYFVTPENAEELRRLLAVCPEYTVIGRGSNLLVRDEGYQGVIICIGEKMAQIRTIAQTENRTSEAEERSGTAEPGEQQTAAAESGKQLIHAGAGAKLSEIARFALQHSLTGFEFAHGIPGTLGGAVVMNAGAYGGEMKDVLHSVELMTPDGRILRQTPEELALGYRYSNIPERSLTVLSASICLSKGNASEIETQMTDLMQRRRAKQPLEFPSAGSTFKRPQGHFAGQLIEESGLKGYTVGGAQVSMKHAGFVINTGNATAADILTLMAHVIRTVRDKTGVTLEPEVRILGG